MKQINFKGEVYDSLKTLHRRHAVPGVSYASFYARYKAGWAIDQALTQPQNKNTRQIFLVDGIEYKGLKAMAEAAKLSYEAVVKRCERGWSDHEIFHGKPKKMPERQEKKMRGLQITVAGQIYENLRAAYSALKPKASLNTVKQRLWNNWSHEQALEVEIKVDGRRGEINIQIGEESFSISDAARKFGVPPSSIADKIARGASSEQAVGLQPIPKGGLLKQSLAYEQRAKQAKREKREYSVHGKVYGSATELAKAYSLDRHLVYSRLKYGWDIERAVTEPPSTPIVIQGREFRSALAAWTEIGKTSFSVFNSRKSAGHNIEICLGLKALKEMRSYEVYGTLYSSIEAVSDQFRIATSTLEARLERMYIQEAIEFRATNGKYSMKLFKRDAKLAKSPAFLYFVEVFFGDSSLHKIGITRRTVDSRLGVGSHKKIAVIAGELEAVYQIEQQLIREFSANHWRADEDFEGRTETFLFTSDEEEQVLGAIRCKLAAHSTCTEVTISI